MQGIKTVWHRKRVEHAAHAFQLKNRFACIQIDLNTIIGDRGCPNHKRLRNPRVIGMQAQRARCRKAIDSYERESAFVRLLIRADELSLYKSRVCVETIWLFPAGLGVGARSPKFQIDLSHYTAEIRYGRRIPSLRMGARSVGQGKRRAVDRSRKVNVGQGTKRVRLRVSNWEGLATKALSFLFILRARRCPGSRPEDNAGGQCSVNQVPSRYPS